MLVKGAPALLSLVGLLYKGQRCRALLCSITFTWNDRVHYKGETVNNIPFTVYLQQYWCEASHPVNIYLSYELNKLLLLESRSADDNDKHLLWVSSCFFFVMIPRPQASIEHMVTNITSNDECLQHYIVHLFAYLSTVYVSPVRYGNWTRFFLFPFQQALKLSYAGISWPTSLDHGNWTKKKYRIALTSLTTNLPENDCWS